MTPLLALILMIGGTFVAVVVVSFMFRTVGLLEQIRDLLTREDDEPDEAAETPKVDPDYAEYLERKRRR